MCAIVKEHRKIRREVGPPTGIIREAPLAKMYGRALWMHFGEGQP